jgi:hypothetical protein
VWFLLLIVLLATLVAVLLWRHNAMRSRIERERGERRARTDQMLARVLLGEDRAERHTIGGGPVTEVLQPPAPPGGPTTRTAALTQQPVDVDILLEGEPTAVAEQARQQLGRPTTLLSGLAGESTATRDEGRPASPPLSLLEGRIEVPLDALVVAWFSARGYLMKRAPGSAQPIALLMTHRESRDRNYAFYFERGRLHAQRAAELLEKARALGMNRLLVAAEHGADANVASARLREVLVLDWVSLDREIRKLDFGIAAKLIAIARTRRGVLGLA